MKADLKRSPIQTCLLAAALLVLPTMVQAQFNYITTNGAITITGYTGSGSDVTIPATINGLPVTSIGDGAFYQTALASVTIGNGVTSIGDEAFFECFSLANVTIGNSVTNIGDSAFYECGDLTSVTIPDSVTSIGDSAFYECGDLTSVTIGNGVTSIGDDAFEGCFCPIIVAAQNPAYSSLNGVLFDKNQTVLIKYPARNAATSYTIPNSVTNIEDSAFYDCGNLASVTIPNSVINIGDYAFESCSFLTNVTIGNSVTNIGDHAFDGADLISVAIPNSVASIGSYAFSCFSLRNVTIGNGVTSIGSDAFEDCQNLTMITVAAQNPAYSSLNGVLFDKNQTVLIKYSAGNVATSYTIPNSVTNIEDSALEGCRYLNSVTIPNSVTGIGDYAFANDTPSVSSLTHVTIGNSVTSIGDYAFAGTSLTSVTIGNSVTSIGNWEFASTALTSVTIPNSATNIGSGAFEYCYSLTNVIIGNSVTSIGDDAFFNCVSLTGVFSSIFFMGNAPTADSSVFGDLTYNFEATVYYLPGTFGWSNTFAGLPTVMLDGPPQFGTTADGWMYVSDQVKYTLIIGYAGSDNAVVIPSLINGLPVTGIAPHTFLNNSSLANATIPDSVTSIGDEAFEDCYGLTSVTIGNGITSIGDWAFADCGLTNVAIPNSVTSIGDGAFYFDTALTSVTIPNSVTSIGDDAFVGCIHLTKVFFAGNAPRADSPVFDDASYDHVTVYYLPGTLGWSNTFAGRPTALWLPQAQTGDGNFGVKNHQFGFNIAWASGQTVVVEAATNLSNPVWLPVSTNTLFGGTAHFSDPQSSNYPARVYRLRSQ